jgi:UPF0271 protein
MKTIDLNCDMGESYGTYKIGMDADVFPYITSANIACGWHAGDPLIMNRTVRLAVTHQVGAGAHPGFPDRIGFGRRYMRCTAEEIRDYLVYQIGALQAFCSVNGTRLRHVKPHGALYLAAVEEPLVARAVAEAIVSVDSELLFVALAGAKGALMTKMGEELGLKVVYEAFPDRAYTPQGTLAPRSTPGALVTEPEAVIERALKMALENRVVALDGTEIELNVQTLCVHGDGPTAVDLVRGIRTGLAAEGVRVAPMGTR